jgi:oligopeptide/dipeptide ABC transporter ATP-binding protein
VFDLHEALDWLGDARLIASNPGLTLTGVSTDTRTVRQGELFVALRGERFDAHDFVDQALEAGAGALFSQPRHPYTRGLIGCIPDIASGKRSRSLTPIAGQIPMPGERPSGCLFGPRCAGLRVGLCDAGAIAVEAAGADHLVRCALWREAPAPKAEAGPRCRIPRSPSRRDRAVFVLAPTGALEAEPVQRIRAA